MIKKTITYLRKQCVALAKKIVYLRDGSICQKCCKKCEGKNRHASHVISEWRSKKLSYGIALDSLVDEIIYKKSLQKAMVVFEHSTTLISLKNCMQCLIVGSTAKEW